jgi:hypothetical protein
MNLVLDQAVEVRLAFKERDEERRSLGQSSCSLRVVTLLTHARSHTPQRRQRHSHSIRGAVVVLEWR